MSPPRLPLSTPSLTIRHFIPGDSRDLFLLSQEEAYRTWLSNQVYETESEARSAVEFLISTYSDPGNPRQGPYVLGVEHRADRRLIGHVGLSPLEEDVEIGFAIGERYQGRGLGTEAVLAASAWTLEAFGLDKIIGIASSMNVASRRTLERARFVHESDQMMRFQGKDQGVSIYALFRFLDL